MFDEAFIRQRIRRSAEGIAALAEMSQQIHRVGLLVRETLAGGRRVLTCGNGGSAAEALHLAEELIGKFRAVRRPFPAVCLNADPTALTCIANDFGFDQVFARQVEALAGPGDLLVVFSTSGKSANIRLALEEARRRDARSIALLGKDGGDCRALADEAVVVPGDVTDIIQETHQVLLHLILEAVESV